MKARTIELERPVLVGGLESFTQEGKITREQFEVERIMIFPRDSGPKHYRVGGQTTQGLKGSVEISRKKAKEILEKRREKSTKSH
jgi:hypothetical protein